MDSNLNSTENAFFGVFSTESHFTAEEENAVIADINQSVEEINETEVTETLLTTTVVKSEVNEENVENVETIEEPIEDQYTVEAIVGKRKRGQKVEYCVKWMGFGAEENTWEPIENLNCDELISAFELTNNQTQSQTPSRRGRKPKPKTPVVGNGFARGLKPKRVVGVSEKDGQLVYAIEWNGQNTAEDIPATVAREKCPQLVIAFLQSKLVIKRNGPRRPLESYRPLASKQFSIFNN